MARDTTRRETRHHYAATAESDYTSPNPSPRPRGIRIAIGSDADITDSEWASLDDRPSYSGRRTSNSPAVGRSAPREATPQQVKVNPMPQLDKHSVPPRPHVQYAMPMMHMGRIPPSSHPVTEPPRGYPYGPLPGPTPTSYPSHFVNYPEPVTGMPSGHNSHPRPPNRNQQAPQHLNQDPPQHQNIPHHQNPLQYQNPVHYQTLPHYPAHPNYQTPLYEQLGPYYPYGNPFANHQQPFQHPMMPYFPTPPYAPLRSPAPPQDPPPETTALDVDKIRVEAQLEIMKAIEHKTKLAEEQKDLEARIRKETEEEIQRRFEATAREQEEAIKAAELMKVEAERKAREEVQAQQRAEIDRERLAAVQAKRLEEDLRTKIRREGEAEQNMRDSRARQREELESRAMNKMLQRMEEVTISAKRKMLHDLGMELEAVDKLVGKSIIHSTEMDTRQTSDTSETTQTTGEESTSWQQSPAPRTTTRPQSRGQFGLHSRRNQTVTSEQSAEEQHEQLPRRSVESPRLFQQPRRAFQFKPGSIDDSTTTTTDSESEFTRPDVPPHAPFPPGNSSYADLETRSDRTESRHPSSGSTKSGDSYGTYDSYNDDERQPGSEYYPPPYLPPLQDLADEIIEVLMHRIAEWQGQGTPRSQPSSYFDQPRRGRSFTARSESPHGGIPMAQSYSSESTRTLEAGVRNRLVPSPRPAAAAIEEEPFQSHGSLDDGASSSEAQTRMDSLILATVPDSDTSHAAGTSDGSVSGVKLLIEDVTKKDDLHVSPNTEVDASLLEESIPAGGQMCIQM